MRYNGVIQRKLALLDQNVSLLKKHAGNLTFEEFEQDWVIRKMAERALQICAEVMIDVAERIIALEGAGPVATASAAMDRLVSLGVLSSAEPYRSIVRFRNLIVHEYEEINPKILYSTVTERLADFYSFRDEIDRLE